MERLGNNRGTQRELTIWQQNLNKSHTGQHDIISSSNLANTGIDIVALQESSIKFLGKTTASRDWILVYPSTHKKEQKKLRAVTLISSKLPTESWEQIDFTSQDVIVIKFSREWGQLVIFNIYNDCLHDHTIHKLTKFHRDNRNTLMGNDSEAEDCYIMWIGDFNRHHPLWDNPDDNRLFTRDAVEAAEILIKATTDFGLEMALAPGIPTHIHKVTKQWTRLDNDFITEHTLDRIHTCEACTRDRGLNTDHVPIVTKIDMSLGRIEATKTKNFRNINWDKFHKTLEEKLAGFGLLRRLANQAKLDQECVRLTKAIQETIAQEVPTNKVCPHSKHWWTKELKEAQR